MKKFYLLLLLFAQIFVSNAQTIGSVSTNNPSCPGYTDGDLFISVNQTTPFTFVYFKIYWQNNAGFWVQISSAQGANLQFDIIDNFWAGNWRADMEDVNGNLLDQAFVTFTEPLTITNTPIISDVSCNGLSDGSIVSNISGGTSPYTLLWNNGSTTQDLLSVSAGTYTLTITDANGCQISESYTVNEPAPINSSVVISQPILGFGNSNGQLTATASGGTTPYFYSLNGSPNQSNPIFTNLSAGFYTITIFDSNGCTSQSSITLDQPPAVTGTINTLSTISCSGYCDGSLEFNVIGGTGPFSYTISSVYGSITQSNNTFNNLCGGAMYTISVVDANSSTFSANMYLNEPQNLTYTANVQTINGYGVTCNWGCDGIISILNVSGGVGAPIDYSFDGGNTFSPIWSATDLCPGTYYLAVRDGAGCIFPDTVTINAPVPLVVSNTFTDLTCFESGDGSIDVSVSGGVSPYTFSWNASNGFSSNLEDISSLDSGIYISQVTDANGCQYNQTITITQPDSLFATYSTIQNILPGVNNASISAVLSGGTSPYTYSWNWLEGNAGGSGSGGIIANTLYSGTYAVTHADINGCAINDTIVLIDPDTIAGCTDSLAMNYDPNANYNNGLCYYCPINYSLYFLMPSTNASCDGFIATPVALTAGTHPVTWYWSNGVSGIDSSIITGLCNDTFSVTMIDANGCGADTTILLSNYVGCTDPTAFGFNPLAVIDDGSCVPIVQGCTDPTAFNYDPLANTEFIPSNCIPFIYGCLDSTACNYNSLANTPDGSCLGVYGCMDPTAFNYNANATCSDSCIATVLGCTNPSAANYNALANTDDGSCWYCNYGCMDISAFNYNPLATCNDTSCIPVVYGCTDPTAFNYDPLANTEYTISNCIAVVYGCMDSNAVNFDSLANTSDGSCYNCGFSSPNIFISTQNMASCLAYAYVDITSINGAPLAYSWTTSLGTYCCNPSQPYAQNLCLGIYDVTITDMYGCDTTVEITIGNVILGCTDPNALNFDTSATLDDGSCCLPPNADLTVGIWHFWYDWGCDNVLDTLYYIDYDVNGTWSNTQTGNWTLCGNDYVHTYDIDATVYNGVYSNGVISGTMSNPNTLLTGCFEIYLDSSSVILGCMDPLALNYNPAAQVSNGSCQYIIAGCTNPLASNYNPSATQDDGSCIFLTNCPEDAPQNLSVSNITQNRATINWQNMNSNLCIVDQYRIRYKEVGTNTWSTKTMGAPTGYDPITGICNSSNRTDKMILNLTPLTTYEYQMKAWYCGGGASAWSSAQVFTTGAECPNVGNFTVNSGSTTQATFTWDDSNGSYSFVRINARVDTNNSTWFNVGGTGVTYGTFTKNKNNLVPGTTYRAKARTWCDPNGGSYKSPSWTSFIFWTQPTSSRLELEAKIDNLSVYPNPTRDIFNIAFTSIEKQDLKVRIVSLVGEEIMVDDLQQFIGEYVKTIDLHNYSKGIYFLEIETSQKLINKKIILQ
ncbi:MAG: hypothetical protein CMD06_03390 [Flavobacteriales bacterium]|nr:hypothetical protein [Flavobacteriales bacterium]